MKKFFTLLLLSASIASFAQATDFNYYKSLGLVQYYERNFLEAIFNLQKASGMKPADKETVAYLKMSYDSIGNKDLSGKMRMKMDKFNADAARRPMIKPAMAGDELNGGGGVKQQKKQGNRPRGTITTDVAGDLRQLGDYFLNRGSYDSAAMCYVQYTKVNPADSTVLFYLATSQYFSKQYDNAISNFEAALHKEPRRAELYNWVGVCELLSGNYLAARDNFKQCIKLDNDYSMAYFNLGKTQYELEDYGDATKNLEHAQEQMPNDPDILKMLADIYYNGGKWEKARNIYEILVQTNAKSERINYRLGDLYLRTGQWNKAVTYFNNLLMVSPNNAEAQRKIGIAYYNLEKYAAAIENFEKASKSLIDDKELQLYGAIASNKLGNYQKGEAFANHAIRLDKSYVRAYYELANACKGLGEKKAAKDALAKAKDLEQNTLNANQEPR